MGLPNVEVGPKVKEDARRQLVDELRARWEMEDAHLAERHALPNEVQVDRSASVTFCGTFPT